MGGCQWTQQRDVRQLVQNLDCILRRKGIEEPSYGFGPKIKRMNRNTEGNDDDMYSTAH